MPLACHEPGTTVTSYWHGSAFADGTRVPSRWHSDAIVMARKPTTFKLNSYLLSTVSKRVLTKLPGYSEFI